MTFESRETSLSGGIPLHLYDFARGTLHWRYCTADRDILYANQTYQGIAISDDGVRQTGQTSADLLTITAPRDIEVAKQFRVISPSAEVSLTRLNMHLGEPEAYVSWIGDVVSVSRPSSDSVRIGVRSLSASFDRPGLTVGWERGCPYGIYDHNCKVNPNDFRTDTTVGGLTAVSITSAAFATHEDGYFDGGYVEWPIEGAVMERRTIERHVGSVLYLFGGTFGITQSQAISAFPGCPQIIDICLSRFNNNLNYGGFVHLPGKSPFDGTPAF